MLVKEAAGSCTDDAALICAPDSVVVATFGSPPCVLLSPLKAARSIGARPASIQLRLPLLTLSVGKTQPSIIHRLSVSRSVSKTPSTVLTRHDSGWALIEFLLVVAGRNCKPLRKHCVNMETEGRILFFGLGALAEVVAFRASMRGQLNPMIKAQ